MPPSPPATHAASTATNKRSTDFYYWNRLPGIHIVIPPEGQHSYKKDERCFSYCSQSVRGRVNGQEPWCRSICIRKVFPHEVRKILRVIESGSQGTIEKTVEVDVNIPLPPEGQRLPSWLTGRPNAADDDAGGDGFDDLDDDNLSGSGKGWKGIVNDVEREARPAVGAGQKQQGAETEVWKQGWYVWMTKNKWAAQEKMDSMMSDLERQAEWGKVKRDVNDEWERARATALANEASLGEDGLAQDPVVGAAHQYPIPTQDPDPKAPSATSVAFVSEDSLPTLPTPPFPDVASATLLLPVPPPLPPLQTYMANLLAPTGKVLKLTRESLVSGDQTRFASIIWDKARTDQPFVLAKNVASKIWTVWTGSGEDEEPRRKER